MFAANATDACSWVILKSIHGLKVQDFIIHMVSTIASPVSETQMRKNFKLIKMLVFLFLIL